MMVRVAGTRVSVTGRAASPTTVSARTATDSRSWAPHQALEVDVTELGLLVEVAGDRAGRASGRPRAASW